MKSMLNIRPLFDWTIHGLKFFLKSCFAICSKSIQRCQKFIANFHLPIDEQVERADQEFLPAAIEILEKPGSPIAFIFLKLITAFTVIALLWGTFGWTDIVAVARGKIQPTGRIKLVQPIEVGKVTKIYVQNGDDVQDGDPLIDLDPIEAQAD